MKSELKRVLGKWSLTAIGIEQLLVEDFVRQVQ
jgi:hypothetical protein